MFGIGMSEMIVIGIIALIFIGPDQIPETARVIGRFINDLRRSTDEVKSQFTKTVAKPLDEISLRPEDLEPWDGKPAHREPSPEDIYEPETAAINAAQPQSDEKSANSAGPTHAKNDTDPARKGDS